MAEGEYRPPRWGWLPRLACRFGLHFLRWDDQADGWRCSCRRQHLWVEQLSNRDDWPGWRR